MDLIEMSKKIIDTTAEIQKQSDRLENLFTKNSRHPGKVSKKPHIADDSSRHLTHTKEDFLCILSHNLRSPFTSILGFTELLLHDAENPLNIKQRQFVKRIKSSAQGLLHLIQDLLDVSSIEAGKIVIDQKTTKLRTIASNSYDRLSFQFISKQISIHNEIDGDITAFIDTRWVNEVFTNLFSNSLKFTRDHGYIRTLATHHNDDFVLVTIEDNGVGVDPDILPYLFDTYRRTSKPGVDGEMGTGLGLPLCRQIVELHHGEIWIESEPQKGTRVFLIFPAVNNK